MIRRAAAQPESLPTDLIQRAVLLAFVAGLTASGSAQTTIARFSHPPAIEGGLSDPMWARATQFTAFKTLHPDVGREPSESTYVYLGYDRATLYVGVHAVDRAPDSIRAEATDVDGVWQDDWTAFCLDPQDQALDAYFFLVTPGGLEVTGVLAADGRPVQQVDRVWSSAVRRTADGYTVEMAIPLAQLPYRSGDSVRMRFKVARGIGRRGEEMDFPSIDLDRPHIAQFQPVLLTGVAASAAPYDRPLFDARAAYRDKVRRLARYGDSTMEGRVAA